MGLGHPLRPAQATAAGLRKAVADVAADEQVRRRIDDIRQEMHRSGGADRAPARSSNTSPASAPDGRRRLSRPSKSG